VGVLGGCVGGEGGDVRVVRGKQHHKRQQGQGSLSGHCKEAAVTFSIPNATPYSNHTVTHIWDVVDDGHLQLVPLSHLQGGLEHPVDQQHAALELAVGVGPAGGDGEGVAGDTWSGRLGWGLYEHQARGSGSCKDQNANG